MIVMLFELGVAAAPFAVVLALLAWADRRERRREEVYARQIALTDTIHERLGAVAAPVVHRRRGRWTVHIALPSDRPAVTDAVLAIVRESFVARDRHGFDIVVTGAAVGPTVQSAARPGARGGASLSWT